MLHPSTELRRVDETIGHGVFATAHLPRGTIVWVQDALDRRLTSAECKALGPQYAPLIERYAYLNRAGEFILCCDLARYVNHSCSANCLSPGLDLEILVRDVEEGEEITDDYATLNLEAPFECACGQRACRGTVRPADFRRLARNWDAQLKAAFPQIAAVPQPLWSLVREKDEVEAALRDESLVPSIRRNGYSGAAAAGTARGPAGRTRDHRRAPQPGSARGQRRAERGDGGRPERPARRRSAVAPGDPPRPPVGPTSW